MRVLSGLLLVARNAFGSALRGKRLLALIALCALPLVVAQINVAYGRNVGLDDFLFCFLMVIAQVSVWLATLHDRAFPLMVRPLYLRRYRVELGEEEVIHRMLMTSYVGGEARHPDAAGWFRRGLSRFDVKAVCLRNSASAGQARAILRNAGFQRSLRSVDYEIWVRS